LDEFSAFAMKALAFVVLIFFSIAPAAENNGRGTKAIALGNAFVAVADNAWAISYNPAGLSQTRNFQASAFFVPQQFGIPELRTTALAATIPLTFGSLGLAAGQFGFDLYRVNDISVGYGVNIDEHVSVGVAISATKTSIARYGSSVNGTLDLGLSGKILKDFFIGFAIQNVTASTIGQAHERLPQNALLGGAYRVSEGFLVVGELEKDTQYPLVLKAAIEQRFFNFLSLRCGIANNPDKFSTGISVEYSSLEFGYAGYSHSDLGWTHQIDLTVKWNDVPLSCTYSSLRAYCWRLPE
jgi:hypothetical protein